MRRLLLAGVVVWVAGCPQPLAKRCGPSLPPCAAGEVCVAEVCAVADDAGTGGGMTGGGMTGGGLAGGTAGGAGGGASACAGGCRGWEVCNGEVDGGRCEAGRVEVTLPVEGAQYDAGGVVTVLATLRLPDGGAWVGAAPGIPVAGDWGATGTVTSGVAGTLAGRATAGAGVVRVGWSQGAGGEVQRNVSFVECTGAVEGSCQPYQTCRATTGGGQCETFAGVVAWVVPGNDSLARGPVDAGFVAEVTLDADAGVAVPAQLPVVQADGGVSATLSRVTGAGVRPARYQGPVTLEGPEGGKVLVAGWPASGVAGLSATRVVRWDETAPAVTVTAEPRPGTLAVADPQQPTWWVKDEVAYVRVTVAGGQRSPQAGDVEGVGWTAAVAPTGQGNCAMCSGTTCGCFTVDMKDAPLAGLRGTVPVRVAAGAFVDEAGNASAQATGAVNVTRVRWVRTLPRPTGSTYLAAPAVDPEGNLVAGAANNTDNTGLLLSVHPTDGGIRWSQTTGAVQAVAVANTATQTGGQLDAVYVVSNEDNAGTKAGRLRAVRASDGGVSGFNTSHCTDGARPMYSAPALVMVGGGSTGNEQVGALGVFNTVTSPTVVNGVACGYRPVDGNVTATPASAIYSLPEPGTLPASPVNVVANGVQQYSVNADFSVERWNWSAVTTLAPQGSLGRGGTGPTQTGQAFVVTGVDAGVLVTSQVSSGTREPLGVVGSNLGNAAYTAATGGFTRAGPPVVLPGSGGTSYLVVAGGDDGVGGSWVKQTEVTVASPTSPSFTRAPQTPVGVPMLLNESLPTSPVYGSANEVYAVTRGGRLVVFSAAPTGLTYAWDAPLGGSGTVVAHPTLDCNRVRGAGAPGLLYTLTTQGTLTAVVVDSPRLGSAPWPKWQRTAGNAGNPGGLATDFPLNPGCPP